MEHEYRVIFVATADFSARAQGNLEVECNRFAALGWRLVSAASDTGFGGTFLFFERSSTRE